jgi:hypothetical protein
MCRYQTVLNIFLKTMYAKKKIAGWSKTSSRRIHWKYHPK